MAKQSIVFIACALVSSIICSADENPAPTAPSAPTKQLVVSSLPENIKLIVGMTDNKFYMPRLKAIHALSDELPPDQLQVLKNFLTQKLESQELPDLEFNALKNELTWILIRQRNKPVDLARILVEMYQDRTYDETWRDYCVQFFGKYYPYAPSEEDKKMMAAGLFDATNDRTGRIAGTAGYMLVHMLKYPEFNKNQIQETVYAAFSDPKCSKLSKVALMQAAAELGDRRVLPQARTIAAAVGEIPLRMSAIAAIGFLGDASDLELLEQLAGSTDIRLQKPALAAIKKIKNR